MSAGYDIQDNVLVKYSGSETEIVIPDGVIEIGDRAFEDQKKIVSVTMPESVIKVGSHAFEKCIKLKEITLSPNITVIEYQAFRGCKALKELVLPVALQELGSGVFAGCEKLSKLVCDAPEFVPESDPFHSYGEKDTVGTADKNGYIIFAKTLFSYIGKSKEIVVPDGVERLANGLFRSGTYNWETKFDIESVVLPDSVKYIGNHAFSNCKKLKSIKMPSGIEIAVDAFDGCSGLSDENGFFIYEGVALAYMGDSDTVNVPNGTRVISAHLFANEYERNPGNKNIHAVNLPEGLEEIGNAAFAGCTLLEKIVIPNSVKKIGSEVFKGCDHLVSVVMPDSVEEMGDGVFVGCRGLADENGFIIENNSIHSFYGSDREIVIPEGIVSIANSVFYKTGITSIQLPSTLRTLGSAFARCDSLTEIIIPEGIEVIRSDTFNGCIRLKKVVLPSTVKHIGYRAFNGCELLEEISIPDCVETIKEYAFAGCKSLKSVCIPCGVQEIGYDAFNGCTSLVSVKLSEGLLKIGNSAFKNCENITEITIPTTVEEIEYSAFENCKSLKRLNYEKGNGTVDQRAFDGCTSLADENGMTIIAGILWKYDGPGGDVVVPNGITALAPNAFREGYSRARRSYTHYRQEGSLKTVVLPTTVKKIYSNAFDGCKALTSINIPDGIEMIGEEAFRECGALKSISIPGSMISLGSKAFMECERLSTIDIEEGIKTIENETFLGCKALKFFHIPASVESIGDMAFGGCKALTEFSVSSESNTYSVQDGMLVSKNGDTLVWFPAGKKITDYAIPENISLIARHAFIDCVKLKKIVIPATVLTIEDEVFPRSDWRSKFKFTEIEVDPKAGSKGVGSAVFDLDDGYDDSPIVYPKLPVTFVKEQRVQVRLGLGYCQDPSKYDGEYAAIYEKYAKSHEKTLTKKAVQLKLTKVQEYFAPKQDEVEGASVYSPNLTMKKPSELAKVEALEEVVQKGSVKDLTAVLETYKSFEITARALGMAARYRGIEFVKVLLDHGATFIYKSDTSLQRKYGMNQPTAAGNYSTEYYLMIVPEKLDSNYSYSAMCGVSNINVLPELKPLSLEKRVEVARFFMENKTPGVSMDEMLFWALTKGEIEFADALLDMGVTLQDTPPSYYSSWGAVPTYITTITEGGQSLYWNDYVSSISALKAAKVLPVLTRFQALAEKIGKTLVLSQKMFDEVNWNDESLAFVLKNADMAKINQKKVLEMAVSKKAIAALELMAEAGWLSNSRKRENLIAFARDNKHNDSLAWLMDFKSRTVDVAAEEAKEEAKMFKELTEDPNSVSAMKKKWLYKKLEDGTLQITGYKGTDLEVEIPAQIGKGKVTSIGEDAFICGGYTSKRVSNEDVREKITSIIIPEGVTEIGKSAFYGLVSLEHIVIPSTLKSIGKVAFKGCTSLKRISIPEGTSIGKGAFWECDNLRDDLGFTVINGILVGFKNAKKSYFGKSVARIELGITEGVTAIADNVFIGDDTIISIKLPESLQSIGVSAFEDTTSLTAIELPQNVKVVKEKAFYGSGVSSVKLNDGLTQIGASAFRNTSISEVVIPNTVKEIAAEAFYGCCHLRDIYIPASVKQLGKEILGTYDDSDSWSSSKPSGIYVHTPAGSAAEVYMKEHYSGVYVANDFPEE